MAFIYVKGVSPRSFTSQFRQPQSLVTVNGQLTITIVFCGIEPLSIVNGLVIHIHKSILTLTCPAVAGNPNVVICSLLLAFWGISGHIKTLLSSWHHTTGMGSSCLCSVVVQLKACLVH